MFLENILGLLSNIRHLRQCYFDIETFYRLAQFHDTSASFCDAVSDFNIWSAPLNQ